jgi:hypothetical protein
LTNTVAQPVELPSHDGDGTRIELSDGCHGDERVRQMA